MNSSRLGIRWGEAESPRGAACFEGFRGVYMALGFSGIIYIYIYIYIYIFIYIYLFYFIFFGLFVVFVFCLIVLSGMSGFGLRVLKNQPRSGSMFSQEGGPHHLRELPGIVSAKHSAPQFQDWQHPVASATHCRYIR